MALHPDDYDSFDAADTPEAMTKSELIARLAERYPQLVAKDAEFAVKTILDAMARTLASGNRIEIRGFGSFTVRPYKPYAGRNPRTGQSVPVPAKRLPFFKVGKELKELVNASLELEQNSAKNRGQH